MTRALRYGGVPGGIALGGTAGLLIQLAFGCNVDSTIAAGVTAEQRLSAQLLDQCRAACDAVLPCPAPEPVCDGDRCTTYRKPNPADCLSGCVDYASDEFLDHGEACADLGLEWLDCLVATSCEELYSEPVPCGHVDDGQCPASTLGDPIEDPMDDVAVGSAWGAAGAGPGPPFEEVTCQAASEVDHADGSASAVICDVALEKCSDDHTYRLTCVETDEDLACSCIVDQVVRSGFSDVSGRRRCPPLSTVNAGCGWALSEG